MNRFALFCTLLLLGLTAAAYVHDRGRRDAPAVLPEPAPAPVPVPAAAPSAGPLTSERLLDAADLRERVEIHVLKPLRGPDTVLAELSRIRRPVRPELALRWIQDPASDAPVPHFELYRDGNPFSRQARHERVARGRIDRRTGRITLSVTPDDRFVDLAAGLRALGVED